MTTQLQTEQGIVRVPSGTWTVDPSHSSVSFEVRHMMIATVRGRFREFEGTIMAAEDLAESRVAGKANVASIDTGQADRDAHLRSADFFDAEHYADIVFESKRIEHVEGGMFRVVGDLTIKDHTHEISVATVVQGAGEDPWDNERVGLQAREQERVDPSVRKRPGDTIRTGFAPPMTQIARDFDASTELAAAAATARRIARRPRGTAWMARAPACCRPRRSTRDCVVGGLERPRKPWAR